MNPDHAISSYLRSILELEDLSEWILIEESRIDSGDLSHRIDISIPIGQQLNTYSGINSDNKQGTALVLISRPLLPAFEKKFSHVTLILIPGEAMTEMGIDTLMYTRESKLSDSICSLFDQNDTFCVLDNTDEEIKKVEILTTWNEWIDIPLWKNLSIKDALLMVGWKKVRLCTHKFAIRFFFPQPVSFEDDKNIVEVLLYRPAVKDFLRARLSGSTLENSLSYLSTIRQRVKEELKKNGQMNNATQSLLDFISPSCSTFSHMKLLESMNGMVVRIINHTDPLDLIGNRSQVFLIDTSVSTLGFPNPSLLLSNPLKFVQAIHIRPNFVNQSEIDIQQRIFGVPTLFPVIPFETIEESLKRLSRLIPGITEFDVASGRGMLKIYHVRLPLNEKSFISLLFNVNASKDDNSKILASTAGNDSHSLINGTLYDYISEESNSFNLESDLLALEHPERSLPPIREISKQTLNVPPSSTLFSASPERSFPSIWARPGDSMRIN